MYEELKYSEKDLKDFAIFCSNCGMDEKHSTFNMEELFQYWIYNIKKTENCRTQQTTRILTSDQQIQ